MPTASRFEIRRYRPGDEAAVVDVLQAAFGTWPRDIDVRDPIEYFRWKHLRSPLGRSLMLVAESDSEVIGFTGWLPCRFAVGNRMIRAMRGVDLAVRPEHRGRGVAAALTRAGAEHVPPETAFTMSNPNAVSRSGILRLGRRQVGRFPLLIRICRPVRAAIGWRAASPQEPSGALPVDAETAGDALADRDVVSSLLSRMETPSDRLAAAKDAEYLRWRYGAFGGYRAIREERDGHLRGMAIFRITRHVATWNTRISELLVAKDDGRLARHLLRRVLAAAAVDYATCHFPSRSVQRSAARQCGFIRVRHGETLLIYPLDAAVRPDPTEFRSWALTLGDLELL